MGNWSVTITGQGSHHNNLDSDVEFAIGRALAELKRKGHTVFHAAVIAGSACELRDPDEVKETGA